MKNWLPMNRLSGTLARLLVLLLAVASAGAQSIPSRQMQGGAGGPSVGPAGPPVSIPQAPPSTTDGSGDVTGPASGSSPASGADPGSGSGVADPDAGQKPQESSTPSDIGAPARPGSVNTAAAANASAAGSVTNVAAERFSKWFSASAEGRRYAVVATQIQALSEEAGSRGVPPDVFRLRLQEASAKNVSPDIVMDALQADVKRWERIAAMIGDTPWPPSAKAPDFYIAAGNALRNGVDENGLRNLIDWTVANRSTPERAGAVLTSASTLVWVFDSRSLDVAMRVIAASRLRVGEFDTLVALLRRASASGRGSTDVLGALESVIGSGGSIRTLERLLFP